MTLTRPVPASAATGPADERRGRRPVRRRARGGAAVLALAAGLALPLVTGGTAGAAGLAPSDLSAPPTAVAGANGSLNVFWAGLQGNLWGQSYDGSVWHPAAQLWSGHLTSAAVPLAATGRSLNVFFRGPDGYLWHTYDPGNWEPAARMTTTVTMVGAPAVASPAPGEMEVFWRGSDNRLWTMLFGPSGWQPAQALPATGLAGPPTAVSLAAGTVDVFYRGGDGNLWHTWLNGSWQTAVPMTTTGGVAGDPQAVVAGPGQIDVFWRGSDANLWIADYAGSLWSPATSLGDGPLAGDPVPVSQSPGKVNVMWRGPGQRLMHDYYNLTWHGASALPGNPLTGNPAVVSGAPNQMTVFADGTDASLWTSAYTTGWAGPVQLQQGVVVGPPTPLQATVVSTAASQIGVSDAPAGGFCNPYTAAYGRGSTTGCKNSWRSEYWCADFAEWVWQHAHAQTDGYLTAAAASFYQWGIRHGTWHWAGSGYVPRPGDAVVFGLDAAGTYADHVGIVASYTPGQPGPNVINGDWWSTGNGAVSPVTPDETTANGSDTISGYASPITAGAAVVHGTMGRVLPAVTGPLALARPGAFARPGR